MANDIELTVPSLTTQGPLYASQISADLTTIATHNHDGVNNGTTIDIAAQDCNEDLSLDAHNLSNVRSVELNNQSAQLTGSQDVNCLYVLDNNLGFNNDDGIFVPLTAGNQPAGSTSPLTNWTPRSSTVTANFSILATDTYNLIDLDSTGGSFTGTLPIAAAITPTAPGRLYLFRDVSGACRTNPITIRVAVASGNTFWSNGLTSISLNVAGAYVAIYTDGISKWFMWTQNVYTADNVSFNNVSSIALNTNSTLTADATVAALWKGIFGFSNGAVLEIINGSGISVEDTSSINMTGTSSIVLGSGTSIVGQNGCAVTMANATTTTFQSGSSVTCSSGSTFTCSGSFQLTNTSSGTCAGSLNFTGTTTFIGTTNITAAGTTVIAGATLNFAGTLSGTSTGEIYNLGTTFMYGECGAVTLPPNGTYNVDAAAFDNAIGLRSNLGGPFTIVMPSAPLSGRRLRIFCADLASLPLVVTLSGNGHNFSATASASWVLTFVSYYAPGSGTISQFSVDLVFTGTEWATYAALNVQV